MRAACIALTVLISLMVVELIPLSVRAAGAASKLVGVSPSSIDVVIPQGADGLERFAAAELDHYLQRLFGAAVKIVPPRATAPTASSCWVRLAACPA